MARYIDADVLMQKLSRMIDYCEKNKDKKFNALNVLFQVGDAIMDCPTADVVPKSEVDKDIKVLTKEVAKLKAMLLDAIDTFRNSLCIESWFDYEDTRKHYVVSIDDVNRIHAELKKKYTEESQ